MPELPEVQTVVNTLRPRIVSRRIEQVELLRQDILTPPGFDLPGNLAGRIVTDVQRRGKRIIITLDDANCFYIHLGMTGRLTLDSPQVALAKHTHLIIHFDDVQMRFRDPRRFGGIWWTGLDVSACDDAMGPEPLTLSTAELASRLKKTARAIKSALLDQRVVAGLGNIYVDESLFSAGIHPLTRSNELGKPQIQRLNLAIKKTLRRAIKHRGSTLRDYVDADGARGGFQRLHRVYNRAGEPCPVCGKLIERIVLGGRSTCWCPACQPAAKKQRRGSRSVRPA